MCFAPQRRALFPTSEPPKVARTCGVFVHFLRNVLRATTACTFSTSELPKVVRTWCALYILTSKCASRHNGVHFFDISTSKSGPTMVCFVHFDFEMCFASQRRALFRHLNFQKWSENGVFCTFWLRNCASRHNGVQFFISHLASWLRTRRFSEPTFRPAGATNHWKTQCFATFLPFRASASSFFWLFLFSDLLSSNLSLLSASALLCFSSVHIVGSLTSKLPSINYFSFEPVLPFRASYRVCGLEMQPKNINGHWTVMGWSWERLGQREWGDIVAPSTVLSHVRWISLVCGRSGCSL